MSNFKLEYRSLLEEEKLMLFGKELTKNYKFIALKVEDIENYYGLFEKLHAGEEIILPEFVNEEAPIRVYVYCENSAGSKYFSKEVVEASETLTPNTAYAKYKVNELLTSSITNTISLFNTTTNFPNAQNVYFNVNISYTDIVDTVQSGMFLSLYKGKIVSASSFKTLVDTVSKLNFYTLRNCIPLSQEDAKKLYINLSFNVPSTFLNNDITENLTVPKEISSQTENYLTKFKIFVSVLGTIFDSVSLNNNSITISSDVIIMNGFTYTNKSSYIIFGNSNKSPLGEYRASDFTNVLDEILCRSAVNMRITNLFSFSNAESKHYLSSSASGSFIFLNEDNLETSKALLACGVQEYVELDKEFITGIKQIYEGRAEDLNDTSLKERFKKEEFAIKRDSVISALGSINKRYIAINSKDKKLLVLTKTSLAKESARKMAITRKISIAVEPVIDMAIRLFTMRDFDTGLLDKRHTFPVITSSVINIDSAITGDMVEKTNPEYRIWFDLRKEKLKKKAQSIIDTTTAALISKLYDDVVYTGSPFWEFFNSIGLSYKNNFQHIRPQQKEKLILSYFTNEFKLLFNDQTGNFPAPGYFSPASGLLNIYNLASSIYYNSYNLFKPELVYLSNASYRNRLSGKRLYYLYVNNFLGIDQEQQDEIESSKNNDYTYGRLQNIPANSGFSFRQDALDSFTTLKKAKTFADYYNWFKSIRPTLEDIIKDNIKDDYFVSETALLFFEQSEQLFESIVKLEEPYLPKEEVKKRGKKSKAAIVAAEVEETETPKGEESGESISIQSTDSTAGTGSIAENTDEQS